MDIEIDNVHLWYKWVVANIVLLCWRRQLNVRKLTPIAIVSRFTITHFLAVEIFANTMMAALKLQFLVTVRAKLLGTPIAAPSFVAVTLRMKPRRIFFANPMDTTGGNCTSLFRMLFHNNQVYSNKPSASTCYPHFLCQQLVRRIYHCQNKRALLHL